MLKSGYAVSGDGFSWFCPPCPAWRTSRLIGWRGSFNRRRLPPTAGQRRPAGSLSAVRWQPDRPPGQKFWSHARRDRPDHRTPRPTCRATEPDGQLRHQIAGLDWPTECIMAGCLDPATMQRTCQCVGETLTAVRDRAFFDHGFRPPLGQATGNGGTGRKSGQRTLELVAGH
jgi:hypothetical protein